MTSSLIVACVKRLISVGLNMGLVGDYKLLQEAKSRFIRRESDEDVKEFLMKILENEVQKNVRRFINLYQSKSGPEDIAVDTEVWGSIPVPVKSYTSVANGLLPLQRFFGAVLDRDGPRHSLHVSA